MEYLEQKEAQDALRSMARAGYSGAVRKELQIAFCREHPTNQQLVLNAALALIREAAKLRFVDGRNEASVNACKAMAAAVADLPDRFPYI